MSDSYSLLCYTRVPTSREEANNEDIAFSMHLALRSHLDGSWTPLNENYGIFFAAGVPIAAATPESRRACTAAARFKTDPYTTVRAASDAVAHGAAMPGVDIELKSLKDPHLFRLASGRFAVAATRTARGGGADGSERSAFLLATSRDLTSYDQRGLVLLGPTSGVHRPTVIYNDAERRYVIRWHDDDGHAMRAVCADIIAAVGTTLPAEPDDTSEPIAASNANDVNATSVRRDYGIADAVPGNEIDITEQEAATLIARFGRVYNTGVTVPSMTVSADLYDGEARDLIGSLGRTTAKLQYSDGSTAMRAVDWDAAQLAALADDAAAGRLKPGERRTVRGRIRQTDYPVPFAVERADPSVFAWNYNGEQLFMFIATDDTDGNCVDPNGGRTHMPLRVATSIADLSDAAGGRDREIDLLTRGDRNSEGRAMTGCFWAPELHVIGGKLSVLFMPCFDGPAADPDGTANDRAGKPDMWTGRCHIMQLRQDADGRDLDPRDPAQADPRPRRTDPQPGAAHLARHDRDRRLRPLVLRVAAGRQRMDRAVRPGPADAADRRADADRRAGIRVGQHDRRRAERIRARGKDLPDLLRIARRHRLHDRTGHRAGRRARRPDRPGHVDETRLPAAEIRHVQR